MKESIYTIAKWHAETFTDATLETQKEKFSDELKELETAMHSGKKESIMMELADVAIVGCGLTRWGFAATAAFNSIFEIIAQLHDVFPTPLQDLLISIDKKMEINRQRKWENHNGKYQHIETQGD